MQNQLVGSFGRTIAFVIPGHDFTFFAVVFQPRLKCLVRIETATNNSGVSLCCFGINWFRSFREWTPLVYI